MSDEFNFLVLLIGGAVSIWLIVLFVGISRRVTAIKRMLLVAYDLEEFEDGKTFGYRRKQPAPAGKIFSN